MHIYGSYTAPGKKTVTVDIVTRHSMLQTLEIGDGVSGLWFHAEDAVEITGETNDTFDVLLRHSCSIRLLAENYNEEFFTSSCRDAYVKVLRDDVCVFAGFVEPMSFSQPFNDRLDEVELNCVDGLSALQYAKYREIGSAGVDYDAVRSAAAQRTFLSLIQDLMGGLSDLGTLHLWYDGSKAVDDAAAHQWSIFSDLSISELLFLGEGEDDVWQQDSVLEELLRYLNLHIVQEGTDFFIFSWETLRAGTAIVWHDLLSSETLSTSSRTVTFSRANAADTDTQITVGETFNRLLLTCETTAMDSVVESPLDSDLLTSPYTNRQKYITEYFSEGDGDHAKKGFYEILTDGISPSYEETGVTDWFLQVRQNARWRFPYRPQNIDDIYKVYCKDNGNQQALPNWLRSHQGAALLSVGKIETKGDGSDNSVVSKVDMTDCLVVSVNGSDDEGSPYPQEADLLASMPRAVYTGSVSGGVFSPSDDQTTNYIVISGSLVLNPCMWMTGNYPEINGHLSSYGDYFTYITTKRTVHSRNNDHGRYYTRKYYKADTPKQVEQTDLNTAYGFCPFTDEGPQKYEFLYSAVGDSQDHISKVAVLQCMLIIGDKCVVESGTQGQPSDFSWQTFKERSECESDEEYYGQSFSIGFDPKIGDKILGTEFDIQNNISYRMGVEASGTAIPIKKSDRVSGQVRFMVLGPVNAYWGDVVRHHHNFWHGGHWSDSQVPLLVHTENIVVKGFEVKVYSDNGMVNNTDDSDLVYMSDTAEDFINEKDDITFKLNSALTTNECVALGITNTVKLSTPLNVTTGEGLLSIYNRLKGEQVKPEQDYVDSYYSEYKGVRLIIEHSILDEAGNATFRNLYTHPALPGRLFHVQAVSRNLSTGEARLTIKEIGND